MSLACVYSARVPTLEQRLLLRSKKVGKCRLWNGMINRYGYGLIREGGSDGGGRVVHVHRAAVFVATGSWPANKLFNSCGNTNCITIEHWFEKPRRTQQLDYEAQRNAWLKRTYGITIDQFNALLRRQRHRCAICRKKSDGQTFSVDHCHKTNRIRGLLCKNCNTALGLISDNPAVATRMAEYLVA